MNTKIQEKLKLLPDKPGVYKMFNAQGELIYVGKAVNLKNRAVFSIPKEPHRKGSGNGFKHL